MPILPVDHPEPLLATLGVMLYPGTEEDDPIKARAFTSQWLAEPLKRPHKSGRTLTYDSLLLIATSAAASLTDLGERIWGGTATGELFKAFFILATTHQELASWNNAVPGCSVPLCWVTRYCSGDKREMASRVLRYFAILILPSASVGYEVGSFRAANNICLSHLADQVGRGAKVSF